MTSIADTTSRTCRGNDCATSAESCRERKRGGIAGAIEEGARRRTKRESLEEAVVTRGHHV